MGKIREAYQAVVAVREKYPGETDEDGLMVAAELSLDPEGNISEEEEIEVATDWFRWLRLEGDPEIFAIHDGELYCGEQDKLIADIEDAYCKKNKRIKCKACGSFEFALPAPLDCQSCNHLVDGTVKQDWRAMWADRFDVVHDHDELLLVAKQRLPTHETLSNHSWVFLRYRYYDPEYRSRDLDFRINASLSVVNVGMAGKKAVAAAMAEYGLDPAEYKKKPIVIAQALLDRGVAACTFDGTGNCEHDVTRQAMEAYTLLAMMGGAVLDRQMNAIGSTGWDFMKDDTLAGLRRYQNRTQTMDEMVKGPLTLGEFNAGRRMTAEERAKMQLMSRLHGRVPDVERDDETEEEAE